MKIKLLMSLIIKVMISNLLFAQSAVTPLKKGDQVPLEMSLGKIVNYKFKHVKFSDFKGKLLILDFWSTGCGVCIANLPNMDKLQQQFGDKIAIIPVDFEDSTRVINYFNRKKLKLPSVVDDSDKGLYGLFPHNGNPYEVWIDENGLVMATTDHREVNSENISKYLLTKKYNLQDRPNGYFDYETPLFVGGNGGKGDDFLGRSVFTNEIENIHFAHQPTIVLNEKAKIRTVKGYLYLNSPIFTMFQECFWNGIKSPQMAANVTRFFLEREDKRIVPIADFSDSMSAIDSIYKLMGAEKYCYNIILPGNGVADSIFYHKYMLEDLNRYSKFNVRLEKRKLSSWIIVNFDKASQFLANKADTVNGKVIFDDPIEKPVLEEIRNMEFESVINFFNRWYYLSPPIFNETGYIKEKINLKDLNLKFGQVSNNDAVYKPMDLVAWRAALQRNGLDIKVEDREVEVMIFKKKETPSK